MATKKKLYELTPAHRKQLKPWADKWIANALNTTPMTEADRGAMVTAVTGLHEAAKLPAPDRVVFAASPIGGAIAASVAAGVWYLRDNPDQHRQLFGRALAEGDLQAAIAPAVAHCVRHGMFRSIENRAMPAVEKAERSAATRAATDAATRAATDAATDAATRDATYDATGAATYDATRAATYDATRDATYDATDAATDAARVGSFLVGCSAYWYRLWNGGNMWSGWTAYLSFFRHVAKLDLPQYSAFAHYEAATIHAGPRFMHRRFCIVSDRPTVIGRDDRNLPHSATGPSIAWRDGWQLYSWHGTRVPARAILAPRSYTRDEYMAIRNTEERRAIGEAAGWAWVAELLGANPVDHWIDPATALAYELLACADGSKLLRKQSPPLKLGDQPVYVEPVHEDLRTAQAARKWQATDLTPIQCEADPVLTYGVEA